MPLASTLKLGGKWSLAATPRLNGTLEVRREEGDLFATDSTTPGPAGLALGITDLALAATLARRRARRDRALSFDPGGHGRRDRQRGGRRTCRDACPPRRR